MMGYTPDTIANYERGRRRISLDDLVKVSRILEKPLSWFLGEEKSPSSSREIRRLLEQSLIEFLPIKKVPVYRTIEGEPRERKGREEILVREELDVDFGLLVQDDSMDPVISPGDLVLCRDLRGRGASSGEIVAVTSISLKGSKNTFRYFLLEEGQYILRAANPAYPDIKSLESEVRIHGVVVLVEKRPAAYDRLKVADSRARYGAIPGEWLRLFKEAENAGITVDALGKILDAMARVKKGGNEDGGE